MIRSLMAVLTGALVAVTGYQLGAVVAFVSIYGIPLGASPPPGLRYFALNLGFAGVAAMAGGWVTARLARRRRVRHAAGLAIGLAALVLWGFTKPTSQWAHWYPVALALLGMVGAITGAMLQRRQRPG